MKPAETGYSAFDHELLAMHLSIKHFQYFVEGCQFHVLTHHKLLTFAFSTLSSKHTPYQIRCLDSFSSLPLMFDMVKAMTIQLHLHYRITGYF